MNLEVKENAPSSFYTSPIPLTPSIERKKDLLEQQEKLPNLVKNIINGQSEQALPINERHRVSLPVKLNLIASMMRFFNRLFNSPTEKDLKDFQMINVALEDLRRTLQTLTNQAYKLTQQEKSGERAEKRWESLVIRHNEMKRTEDQAKTQLKIIQQHEKRINELAEAFSRYDYLPEEMQKLQKNVEYMQRRITILEQILCLDTSILDYERAQKEVKAEEEEKAKKESRKIKSYDDSQQTWNEFQKIQDQINILVRIISCEINHQPNLKKERDVRFLDQAGEEFSTSQVYKQIKKVCPGLLMSLKRVFDHATAIQKARIKNLERHAKVLESWSSLYYEKSSKINELERKLYTPSMARQLFTWIAKIWGINKKQILKKEIEQARSDLQKITEEIKKRVHFIPEEVKWFKELAEKNKEFALLSTKVETMTQLVEKISLKNEMTQHINQLIEYLKTYKVNRKFKHSPKVAKIIATAQQKIPEEVKSLIALIHLMKINRKSLPKTFNQFSPLSQLKILIKIAFPHINAKIEHTIKLLQKMKVPEVNDVIKEAVDSFISHIPKRNIVEVIKEQVIASKERIVEEEKEVAPINFSEPLCLEQSLLIEEEISPVASEEDLSYTTNHSDEEEKIIEEDSAPPIESKEIQIEEIGIEEEVQEIKTEEETFKIPPPPPKIPPAPKFVKLQTTRTSGSSETKKEKKHSLNPQASLFDQIKQNKKLRKAEDRILPEPKEKHPLNPRASLIEQIQRGKELRKVDPVLLEEESLAKNGAQDEKNIWKQAENRINQRRHAIVGSEEDENIEDENDDWL